MPMQRLTSLALAASLIMNLAGCATAYRGREPDLSVRGAAAQKAVSYEMGPNDDEYTIDSLAPTLEKVSPKAVSMIEDSQWLAYGSLIPLGLAIAVLAAEIANPANAQSSGVQFLYYGLLGVSLGFSLTRIVQAEDAAIQYNRDLKAKLTPGLALNWRW
jgi:hypothetical protein